MKNLEFYSDDSKQKKEKHKARILRNSQWWKRKRGEGICYYCKKKYHTSELTMDHIVPIARGGLSTKNNVVPACKECNTKKKNLLPIEWKEYLKKLKIDNNVLV